METDLGNKTIGLKQDADLAKRDNWGEYLDFPFVCSSLERR